MAALSDLKKFDMWGIDSNVQAVQGVVGVAGDAVEHSVAKHGFGTKIEYSDLSEWQHWLTSMVAARFGVLLVCTVSVCSFVYTQVWSSLFLRLFAESPGCAHDSSEFYYHSELFSQKNKAPICTPWQTLRVQLGIACVRVVFLVKLYSSARGRIDIVLTTNSFHVFQWGLAVFVLS